jgi:endonuclease/exonuclease/phosphatase family metal-dependent hydrolase
VGIGIEVDSEGAVYVRGYTESVDFPTQNPIQGSYGGQGDTFITKINSSGKKLIYSTYLGGSGWDWCWGIAVDSEGAAYVTGNTESRDFPTKNAIQGSNAGGYQDAFITKINSSGSALIYSTYLGGSAEDNGTDIAVDSEGAAYVTGQTESEDFPTKNPIQRTNAGGSDIFIAKVNSSGSALIYSTYFGGSYEDGGWGTAVDSEGAVYVSGFTESYDFPTKNPIQENNAGQRDAFITKIDTSERIRIVSWNILDYPDLNGEPREEYFQSVLEYLSPDILVVQEMTSFYGVDQFLKNILKPISKKYKAANFFDGPDTDNALFYDKSKIKLQSRQQILTSFRDISEYSLKIKKGPGKGSKLKIYSVNFTEGLNASETNQRENEANILRAYLNGLSPNSLFMVCGTFNMTGSDEEAYKILTGDQIINIGRAKDPINKAGKWHDNKKSRLVHTESTRKSEFGGGVRGGLDDRFDMILISYSLDQDGKLIYKPGSYVIYGNDGKHFNKAINKPKNKVVSPEIADALYEASDHLPVVINLVPQDKSLTKDRLN